MAQVTSLPETRKRGDKVDTEECAAWSNQTLRDLDYLISGNAWSLNGVDTIFNGYNKLQRPAEYSRVAVQRHNQEATDSVYRDFDSNSLDKSQPYVVNMFYKGSPAQERAYKEGKRSDWYTYWNTLIPGWSVGCYS